MIGGGVGSGPGTLGGRWPSLGRATATVVARAAVRAAIFAIVVSVRNMAFSFSWPWFVRGLVFMTASPTARGLPAAAGRAGGEIAWSFAVKRGDGETARVRRGVRSYSPL